MISRTYAVFQESVSGTLAAFQESVYSPGVRRKNKEIEREALELTRSGVKRSDAVRMVRERHDISQAAAYTYFAEILPGPALTLVPAAPAVARVASPERPAQFAAGHQEALQRAESVADFRDRWAAKLEAWVAAVERDLLRSEELAREAEHGKVDPDTGELLSPSEVYVLAAEQRAEVYGKLVKVVDRLHKLRGADAPVKVAVAHLTPAQSGGIDPRSMSPAERRREIDRLREMRERMTREAIDVDDEGEQGS